VTVPTLPVFNDEPMTSLLGVMRFPNDLEKAAAYASWCLANKIKPNDAATIGIERILPILIGTARQVGWHEEWSHKVIAGTAAGEVVKTLFALIGGNPNVASWKHAIDLTERAAVRDRHKSAAAAPKSADTKPRQKAPAVSSATLRKYLLEFSPVLHLWGAWCIRGRRWMWDDSVGYSLPDDVDMFISESELLFRVLQRWDSAKTTQSKYLGGDVFRVAHDWRPPLSRRGWPRTGTLPLLKIDEVAVPEVANLKKSGRPANPV
jgi:hypothetical protein